MLLDSHSFVIIEKKTGKRREIKVNNHFQKHIADCYTALNVTDKNEKCFVSRKKRYIVRKELTCYSSQ